MAKTLPPLPTSVWSVFGPVPVTVVPDLRDEKDGILFGRVLYFTRRIEIRAEMSLVTQWQTLEHERVHLALFDAGARLSLTNEQEEAVCDSLATARVAEMLATTSTGVTKKRRR